MINFSDLKQQRIKKTLEFNGEKINILNPTKEIKEKIMEVVGKCSKKDNNTVEIDISYEDNPEFVKNIFQTLVEGIEFPDDTKTFEEVMDNPLPIVKEIQYEIANVIRSIGMERALELKNEIQSATDLTMVSNIMKELDEFAEKNKDFKVPEIAIKKNDDITPKPKTKPKRKSTKKTKKENKEDKIIELDKSKKDKKEKEEN
ncbi:TPA: hypothetical protein PTV74_003372 [Clostridium botulinum]|nr:hypothetical protein [Clostridium botulinum]HDK7206524.1 hypothetical protein [Clostridium botulinum]HDK7210259.1 hypothetical protein [Clostridium botulinum]HDK7265709.1 hypothetical protein [Clostridium botulinum]HDK7269556.1 hypothetical protein [Clostridium botulinum]